MTPYCVSTRLGKVSYTFSALRTPWYHQPLQNAVQKSHPLRNPQRYRYRSNHSATISPETMGPRVRLWPCFLNVC